MHLEFLMLGCSVFFFPSLVKDLFGCLYIRLNPCENLI